ncbi:MAG: hypothetical protein PHI12_06680 [Dehalococcoidales bacterium]|nr:hypothetical protein [Dehalococcoidales bacterium]
MAKKPLYPHIPGSKKVQFPHRVGETGPAPGQDDLSILYKTIEADLHREGEYDPDVIMAKVITDVLDGYEDKAEALYDADVMRKNAGRRYTPAGYEITPEVIFQAVKEADERHYFGPIRPELVEQTAKARKLAQKVAITEKHPAYREYQELWNQLNWAEIREVRKKSPGLVAGYRD